MAGTSCVPSLTPVANAHRGFRRLAAGILIPILAAAHAPAQQVPAAGGTGAGDEGGGEAEVVHLPEFVLSESRVANEGPASSFATPATALRFEPRVDLQTRNFGEAQGDITIRGGIFEGTAVQVSGLTVFDPQTGHYTAELPVPPEMLTLPQVETGVDHAFAALNATVGTVHYDWREIRTGGSAAVAVGNGNLRRGALRLGQVLRDGSGRVPRIGLEAEAAASRADGTVRDGDHEFTRFAARAEIASGNSRTQLFAGTQAKFFGWPNLYTPFGVAETEDLHTRLFVVAHDFEGDNLQVSAAAFYRRNRDDYEFDRYRPGLFNPYLHVTRARGAFASVAFPTGPWRIRARAELAADALESTALTAGRFSSRVYRKLGVLASRRWAGAEGSGWEARFGATYDDTNREGSAISPLAEIAWTSAADAGGASRRWYLQYSESTRVPDYTALNSPSGGGLFRGNPDLGREQTRNLETGFQLRSGAWSVHTAVFVRRDDPLVDWTFTAATPNARSAQAVRLDNVGFEALAARTWGAVTVIGGYTWLEKDADYGTAAVDASFYALNYPRHRLTLALTADLGAGFSLRADNEFRIQAKNLLRTTGGDHALLSALGLYWRPPALAELELSLVVDNLWKSRFQELPAVPAPGRQVALGATWSW